MVKLCLKFDPFIFNEEECAQLEGLAMGSPLSPVAACLFMEMLEDQFTKIMGRDTNWFRYIDDILIISPEETDLSVKLQELNHVHSSIQFTLEEEINKTLNFLDVTIIRGDDEAKFKVFPKPTNKEDYVHFYSAHSSRIKSGIVIGFFLRALRICSQEYLDEKMDHVFKVFRSLKYPKSFLIKCQNKARKIMRKKAQGQEKENKPARNDRFIILPRSEHLRSILEGLSQATGIKVIERSGKKIGDIIRCKEKKIVNENSIVYRIPCRGCQKSYICETYRGLKTRIAEHRRDIKNHRETNSMVLHVNEEDHFPMWEKAEAIKKGMSRTHQIILESALTRALLGLWIFHHLLGGV